MRLLSAATRAPASPLEPTASFAREAAPANAPVEVPTPPTASPDCYPWRCLGQGETFNCADFVFQADAQAVLHADPSDPNKLDTDRPRPDGIACESNKAPFDRVAVPR
jgi:hypothetical protein